MTENDVVQCVAYMGRLFPSMSRDPDRLVAIGKAFRPLQVVEVRRAIESRVGLDQFPDVPAIVAWCTPPSVRPDPLAGGTMRVNGMTADELRRQALADKAHQQQKASDRAAVAALPEQDRERLRQQVLQLLDPQVRSIYARRPTLESPVLMRRIVELSSQPASVHGG